MYVGCYDYDYLMVYLGGRGGGFKSTTVIPLFVHRVAKARTCI